jgi:hypothetical protein
VAAPGLSIGLQRCLQEIDRNPLLSSILGGKPLTPRSEISGNLAVRTIKSAESVFVLRTAVLDEVMRIDGKGSRTISIKRSSAGIINCQIAA